MTILERILGGPLSSRGRDAVFLALNQHRSPEEALKFYYDGYQHNTTKSGALLGAQGIFLVVDVFALEHGWPKGLLLTSMLVMFLGSLIAMTNLRGTAALYLANRESDYVDVVWRIYRLVLARTIRFNCALYLTFVSVALLAIAAIAFVV